MAESPWTLDEVTARLAADVPVIAGGLLANISAAGDPRRVWAERALAHVRMLCSDDPERLTATIEAFAITSFDFLRLQGRFLKTGHYACGSAADLSDLYSDPEQMVEYLDGLALSYAMWPNHAVAMSFFAEKFVRSLGATPRVLEIGPGHGLFASLLLERRPDAVYRGVDISASSLAYTDRSLRAAGIPEKRFDLIQGDVTVEAGGVIGDGFEAIVCCEVLEHVDQPERILDAIAGALSDTGSSFLTTVANMEAVDHVFLFDDVDHIRSMIGAAGLTIVDDQPVVLAGAEAQERTPVNYSAIVRREAT